MQALSGGASGIQLLVSSTSVHSSKPGGKPAEGGELSHKGAHTLLKANSPAEGKQRAESGHAGRKRAHRGGPRSWS